MPQIWVPQEPTTKIHYCCYHFFSFFDSVIFNKQVCHNDYPPVYPYLDLRMQWYWWQGCATIGNEFGIDFINEFLLLIQQNQRVRQVEIFSHPLRQNEAYQFDLIGFYFASRRRLTFPLTFCVIVGYVQRPPRRPRSVSVLDNATDTSRSKAQSRATRRGNVWLSKTNVAAQCAQRVKQLR